jgi:glycosyltransferase involved in cell wall biosynthesis
MRSNFSDYEIIVINDASTDRTSEEVSKFEDVKLVSHPYNKGNGSAVRTGIRNAKKEFVVMMDADGQHDITDIVKIVESLGVYDCVVGARTEASHGSFHRNIANRFYNRLASYVTNIKIEDLTSGYRGFRTSVIKKFLYMFPNGFSYPTTSTLAIIKAGYNLKYCPIRAKKRIGTSKIRILRDGFRFLLIIIKIAILFSPLKVFLPVSLVFILGGLMHMFYKIILLGARYTQFSIFLISVGVIIFLIGLLSEQISTLRYDKVEED